MALIKYSALVSDMRNKLNGSVLAKGSGGQIIRNKITPVNPATNAMQLVRAQLSSIAQGWRALTDAQRAAWEALAQQVTGRNIFGDGVTLSGIAIYSRINRHRQSISQAVLTDAPALPTLSQLTSVGLTGAAGTPALSLTFAPTVPTGHTMVVQATAQQSPGRANVRSRFVQLQTVAAAQTSPQSILTAYNTRFGTLVAGNKVFVRVFFVHIASGFATVPLQTSATIAA